MLILLSPSKTLDFHSAKKTESFSLPQLLDYSKELISEMKKLSAKDIAKMMKISEKLAELNHERYQNFHFPFTPKNSRQAILAFIGDVYRDIDTAHYSEEDFQFAQSQIRILSGLYGYLRPLDLIQPYRLEMKYKAPYWRDKVTTQIAKEPLQPIINLASNEYSSPVDFKALPHPLFTIFFKEKKGPDYKIVALYSKIARGTMANWIIKNRITKPEDLKKFQEDGYKFSPKLSIKNNLVFIRG